MRKRFQDHSEDSPSFATSIALGNNRIYGGILSTLSYKIWDPESQSIIMNPLGPMSTQLKSTESWAQDVHL